jgi:replicative DNA helicase Mcm
VYLKEDLTTPEMQRKTDPGNRLRINGIVKEIRKVYKGKMKTQMDIYIEANYVESAEIEWEEVIINQEDEDKIKELAKDPEVYNKVVASIAPSIFGMDKIKEAVLLQLFGGVGHNLPDKTKIRGDIHILLIGDPSTGKSQLLKLISSIIPRGKYVGGRGASAAGLTATVVKDEEFGGGWMLEAGAMVLANKGVLAIDEFDKMSKEDQIAMHEGLEQQQISIAKASIVATLPAQVSVLAGANPKFFRFDLMKSIADQIDIPDTLLSRFDLKFALKDVPNAEQDDRLATHILETRLQPSRVEPKIKPDFLRKYIAYARKNCKPQMTREAAEKLKKFYLEMRSMYSGEAIAITLRQNEALMRLAEASAKIRLDTLVRDQDAERAIDVMRFSINQLGYDMETGKIDIDRTEGVSASQRSKIHILLDIIDMLEKKMGKPVPKEEVIATAEEQGIKSNDAEELLRRLKTEGSIFEPRLNFVERIR